MAKIGQVKRQVRTIMRGPNGFYISQPGKDTISGGYKLIWPDIVHGPAMQIGESKQIEVLRFEVEGAWYEVAPIPLKARTMTGIEVYYPQVLVGTDTLSYRQVRQWLANRAYPTTAHPPSRPTAAAASALISSSSTVEEPREESKLESTVQLPLVKGIFGPDYARHVVTDGTIEIPFTWPVGRRARKRLEPRALRNILEVEWEQFTRRVVGWRWDEIKADLKIVFHQDPPNRDQPLPEADQLKRAPEYESELVQTLQHNGFNVSLGGVQDFAHRAVIRVVLRQTSFYWVIARPRGVTLSLSGGIYIFSDQDSALMFAREEVTPSEALRQTINGKRVNFSGDWSQRARQVMYGMVLAQP